LSLRVGQARGAFIHEIGERQIVMDARQSGIECDSFLELIDCLRQAASHPKCPTDHDMKLRLVAEMLKHPIKDLPCISKLALLQVRDRKREAGIEVVRT